MVTQKNIKSKRPPEWNWQKVIYTGLGFFYIACMVYIFFFARRRWGPFPKRSIHFTPFEEKIRFWQTISGHSRMETLEFYKDLVGNILLFVPFPFFLSLIIGIKRYPKLLLISALVSLFVEIVQFTCNIGVADIDDLILNSMGASIGLLVMYCIFSKRRTQYSQLNEWQTA
ncbi:MAG: VanZ family protein [Chitinophagales bacterium]